MSEVLTQTQPKTETITTPATVAYSAEAWEQLEAQRQQMLNARIDHYFADLQKQINGAKAVETEIIKAAGTPEEANDRIVLLAAKNADNDGILLSDLRRFIPDPNHLNKARENLLGAEDKNGNKTRPVLISEKRGENNELRVFAVEATTVTQ